VSSLRPFAWVALHVLFLVPCGVCGEPFQFCRSCEPGRRYCSEECSLLAKQACVRRARKKYRLSPEGRAQHRDEEAERRERRHAERVGDRRCPDERVSVQVVAAQVAAEPADAAQSVDEVEWLLVVWPGLLALAERWLGEHVACPFCGHHGRVARLIAWESWRRSPDGGG
jgi:hypothetical protein